MIMLVCPECRRANVEYEPLRRRYVCMGLSCNWSGLNPITEQDAALEHVQRRMLAEAVATKQERESDEGGTA